MRVLRGIFFVTLAAGLASASPAPAAPSWAIQSCNGHAPQYSLDEQIRGCTELIERGNLNSRDLATVYNNRGTSYMLNGQYDQAILDFDRSIGLDRDYRTYNNRGMAYAGKGQYDRAIADYSQSIALKPDYATALSNRGSAYLDIGEYDRAISDFERAISFAPDSHRAFKGRGIAFAAKGQYERAIGDFNRAIAIKPDDASAYGGRGYAYLKLEKFDRAIADSQQALRFNPNLDLAITTLREAQEAKAALQSRLPPLAPMQRPVLAARIALVIGNGTYQHIGRLANAENDAADIGRALAGMGYRVFGYPKTNFTRSQMDAEIDAFRRAAVDAETAFVWYAGHGQEFVEKDEIGRNWLIPVDARVDKPADVYANGVAMSRLINAAIPARTLRVVVIDACRNSNLPSATRAIGPRLAIEQRTGMMIVFSTRSGTVALDGGGRNSPFAAAFLDAARDKSRLDVRQFFGAVARGTLERTKNAQEPELIVRLQTDALLPLVP